MINVGNERVSLCGGGPNRRSFLQIGTAGLASMTLPSLLKASTEKPNPTIGRGCVLSTIRPTNGASTPGAVPQVTWKRGTELPWPSASAPPRSARRCANT